MYPTAKTKVLTVYGKRKQRIVSISDENHGTPQRALVQKKSEVNPQLISKPKGNSPKIGAKKFVARTSESPTSSPWSPFQLHRIHKKQNKGHQRNSVAVGSTPSPRRIPFADVINSPLMKKKSSFFSRPGMARAPVPPVPRPGDEQDAMDTDEEEEPDIHIRKPLFSNHRSKLVVESSPSATEASSGISGSSGSGSGKQSAVEGSPEKPIIISSREASSVEIVELSPVLRPHPPPKITYGRTKASKKTITTLISKFNEISINVDDSPPVPAPKPAPILAPPTPRVDHPVFKPPPPVGRKDFSVLIQGTPGAKRAIQISPRRTRLSSRTPKVPAVITSPVRRSLLPAGKKAKHNKVVEVIVTIPAPPKAIQAPVLSPALPLVASVQPPVPQKSTFQQSLTSLVSECQQVEVIDFDFFLSVFTAEEFFAHIAPPPRFHSKIGEATYSEVFGCGDCVLKIIPLRDPTRTGTEMIDYDNWPTESEVEDVCREISTTRALGDLAPGFVKLIRAYVVKGKYPKKLLSLWDAYEKKKGSENIRPDCLPQDQHFAIIVLPNGGPDLESYDFKKSRSNVKHPWKKACAIFWQVVYALERAEDLAGFEHRDLHWGQILVKDLEDDEEELPMTEHGPPTSGVKVTIIDLGLARMDGYQGEQRWSEPEDEIFEGEGDYQFDVYRMMKAHNGGEWSIFCPLTNVMWLHYLVLKLLHNKRIRVPSSSKGKGKQASRRSSTKDVEGSEEACYATLLEVERILEENVKVRSCRMMETTKMRSARDMWRVAQTKGWV